MMRAPRSLPHPIIGYVAGVHGLTPEHIISDSRRQRVCEARAVAAWMLKRQGHGSTYIGELLHRSASSVGEAIDRVERDKILNNHAHECLYLLEGLAVSVGMQVWEWVPAPARRKAAK